MKKESKIPLLKVQKICEVKQNDKVGFGLIAFIDQEINEVYKFIFWLFSQQTTPKYRYDNYIGRSYEGIAKSLGVSEVKACELLIRKLEKALTLGFEVVIDKAIERKLELMKIKLRKAKYRESKEGLKHG